jgi:hypothetical protein
MRGIEHMAALGTHERQSLTAWQQLGQRRILCEVATPIPSEALAATIDDMEFG